MFNVNIDYLGHNGQIQGNLAAFAQAQGRMDVGLKRPYISPRDGRPYIFVYKGNGADPKKVSSYAEIPVTNATLRRDEWKSLDEAVLKISETRLNGIQDLIDNGLTFNLGNAMGTTVLETHDLSDAMEADLTMDAITRSKGDRPVYGVKYLPIPIIHVDYEINARVLAASRSLGNALDTTSAERAGRKVAERLESMLFTNVTYAFGSGTIYSYINHPDRNSVTLSTNWDASAKSPKAIVDEVLSLKQTAINAKHYGPYMVYIPTAYETVLDGDYEDTGTTSTNKTIRARILEIENIKGIKVIDTLPANNVLLVQMTTDVVRLVRGLGIQNIEWTSEGGMVTNYKVMTIQVPQIRSDQEGNSGIVHLAA